VFISEVSPVAFDAPWVKSFDERMMMLRRGSPRAAYFYETPDTSTFRYRIYNVCQSLAADPAGASASWFHLGDLEHMDRVFAQCDVFILCRTRYDDRIARMVGRARARGLPVLFDCDDLIFDVAHAHTLMDTLGENLSLTQSWDTWFGHIARQGQTMRLCDSAIVTNSFLAARAEAFMGKPARIIPNYINQEQAEISRAVWDAKEANNWAGDGRIHIGYFSGSPSHNRDFALVSGALGRLMDEDDRITLRVVGFLDSVGPDLQRHGSRIESIPLQDFINLQREIGQVEINIVPLQDNIFTNCKSNLKWFEAAVTGSLTIAAPSYTFREVIRHGENGWLAPVQRWGAIMQEVIAMPIEAQRLVASQAREDAERLYGWRHQSDIIKQALFT